MTEFNIEQLLKDMPLLAQSANDELRTLVKSTVKRVAEDMDLVDQEEIAALKQMLSRMEARVAQLEEALNKL